MTDKRSSDSRPSTDITTISMDGTQFILPVVLCFALAVQAVSAAPPGKKYNNDNEFVPETLQQPPDLPYLPPYTGTAPPKYSSILAFKRKPDGPGYSLTFHAKEPPDEVLGFYRNAFKNNRWQPQKSGDQARIVSGMRKGAVATVTVMNPVMKGYKTQVYIVYKVSGSLQ